MQTNELNMYNNKISRLSKEPNQVLVVENGAILVHQVGSIVVQWSETHHGRHLYLLNGTGLCVRHFWTSKVGRWSHTETGDRNSQRSSRIARRRTASWWWWPECALIRVGWQEWIWRRSSRLIRAGRSGRRIASGRRTRWLETLRRAWRLECRTWECIGRCWQRARSIESRRRMMIGKVGVSEIILWLFGIGWRREWCIRWWCITTQRWSQCRLERWWLSIQWLWFIGRCSIGCLIQVRLSSRSCSRSYWCCWWFIIIILFI